MKQRFTRLISTILALAMLAELLPANFLGALIPQASAAEVPSVTGFEGIPQPEELPTTIPIDTDDLPPTVTIDTDFETPPYASTETIERESSVQPTSIGTGETEETEDEDDGSNFFDFDAPYTYDSNQQEQINLNTGSLFYTTTDYTLPGKNGLDLVIGRHYNSRYASRYGDWKLAYFKREAEFNSSVLGQGWSFCFPYMETTNGDPTPIINKRIMMADGSVLRIGRKEEDTSHYDDFELRGGAPGAMSYIRRYGPADTPDCYVIPFYNGHDVYFDEYGRVLKIEDSYENRIQFAYSGSDEEPVITITDTYNRITRIVSSKDDTGNTTTTVTLPDNNTLIYRTEPVVSDAYTFDALASYTNSVGQTEHYAYTLKSGEYSSEADTDYFLNLTTVTHPTGAQTYYEYEKYSTWVYQNIPDIFALECYRVIKRYDKCCEQILNQRTYAYTPMDCTGYPERTPRHVEYGVTITDSDGNQEIHAFNDYFKASPFDEKTYFKTIVFQGNTLCKQRGNMGHFDRINYTEYYHQSDPNCLFRTAERQITLNTYDLIAEEILLGEPNITLQSNTYEGRLLENSNKLLDEGTRSITENTITKNRITKSEIKAGTDPSDKILRSTAYEYDTSGNLIAEKLCLNPNAFFLLPRKYETLQQYAYTYNTDSSYQFTVMQSGVKAASGEAAASTPNQPAGTIQTTYFYDSLGRLSSIQDANGYTTQYTYDVLGNLTGVVNPDGTRTSYVRDYVNNILTYSDENNNQTRYTYTPLGLPQDVIDVQTGNILSRREYDSMSRLIRLTDYVYGSVTEYTYDGYGNVNSETVLQGNDVLSRTTWIYNEPTADGQYLRNTKTVHGDSNTPDIVTTEYRDIYGNVAKTGRIIDGTEYFDTYTYDFQGTVLSVLRAADAAKNLPFTEKYEYNYNNQVIKHTNAAGQVITNTYDAFDRLVQTTDYAGTPTTYTYDSLGRLLTQTAAVDTNQTVTTKYEYDPAGNLTHEWTPVNALGQTDSWTETVYSYDSRQRLSSVGQSQWLGTSPSTATTYTYDGVGNLLSASVGGNTTAYTYDRYGNVCSMTDPSSQTETYAYTALGKPISKTDRNGQVIRYTYNALGQLLSETAGTDYRLYTYAPTGQKAAEQNNWYRTAYTYDGAGRTVLVEETEQMTAGGSTSGTISYSKQYTYDPADNRTGFTLTRDGTVIQDVAYTYDSLNRLSTVSEAGIQQAEYAYDTNGNRASLTYANGVVERYTYNKANWITGISNQLGDTVISSFDYTYYASGNQKTKTDHTGKITSYTYDGMGRLTQEAESGGVTVDYTYNAAGNRTGMSVSGTENYNTTYVYDGNNCIRYEVQHNGTTSESVSYSHDGNGNIISETVSGGGSSTYTYNHFNQLSTANRAGTFTYYAYNAAGIRTGKMAGLIRTAFLLDGGNVAAELENGRVTNNYLRGANLIRWTSGMGTGYYLYNAHGDVVNLTNPAGASYRTYSYDAFGKQKNPDSFDFNPFRYCGEYYDKESGNYYLRSRYYNPANGRFTQPDSHWNSVNRIYGDNPQKINERQDALGTTLYSYRPQISAIMQSGNLYAYCMNNPVNYLDASGKIAIVDDILFGLGIFAFGYGMYKLTQSEQSSSSRDALTELFTSVECFLKELTWDYVKSQPLSRAISRITNGKTTAVHHIVAKQSFKAKEAQEIMAAIGIDWKTDERNLVSLDTRLHYYIHTDNYYAYVNSIIVIAYKTGGTPAEKEEQVLSALATLKQLLIDTNAPFEKL